MKRQANAEKPSPLIICKNKKIMLFQNFFLKNIKKKVKIFCM